MKELDLNVLHTKFLWKFLRTRIMHLNLQLRKMSQNKLHLLLYNVNCHQENNAKFIEIKSAVDKIEI